MYNTLTSSFPICSPFILFFCPLDITKTSYTKVKRVEICIFLVVLLLSKQQCSIYPCTPGSMLLLLLLLLFWDMRLWQSLGGHSTHKFMHMQDSRFLLINPMHSCGNLKAIEVSFLIPVQCILRLA